MRAEHERAFGAGKVASCEGEPPSLHELVRRDIVSGVLPAGARLKTQDLAGRYGVSINPVREALHQLSGEGFVVLSRNRGARVRPLDEHFVRNIFHIRALIEGYLIRFAIEHATEADLRQMRDLQRRIDGLVNDQLELDRLDEEFHGITYGRHFNEEALSIRERHGQVVHALALRYPASPARRATQNAEHWAIIDAIERHDEAEAVRVVEQHARGAEKHLLERLRQTTANLR